ncbi:hypothetical protein PanWU01x14_018540, partial [Parasponia andersonii]
DVAPQFILVNDHGGEGRGRGEEAAVHYEDVDVLGLEARLREQGIHGGEDDELGLSAGGLHGRGGRDIVDGRGEAGLLPEARAFENPHLELDALGVVLEDKPGVLHEGGEGDAARDRGLVARVVD